MKKKKKTITKHSSQKAVAMSSKIEGLSLAKAKKDTSTIKLLQKYGRALSLQHK